MSRLIRASVLAAVASATALLSAAPVAAADHPVPFHSRDSGTAQAAPGPGDLIRTTDVATGQGTHVGRYTLQGAETINMVTGAITEGEFTIVAADGSTLFGTYSGQALAGLSGYDVSGPVTGGTGRFDGATGFLTWHGVFDPATFTLSDRVSGHLSW